MPDERRTVFDCCTWRNEWTESLPIIRIGWEETEREAAISKHTSDRPRGQ